VLAAVLRIERDVAELTATLGDLADVFAARLATLSRSAS
jgi:hypothetical protein